MLLKVNSYDGMREFYRVERLQIINLLSDPNCMQRILKSFTPGGSTHAPGPDRAAERPL